MTVDPSAVSGETASVERFDVDSAASDSEEGEDSPRVREQDVVRNIDYRWPTAEAAFAVWPEGWSRRGGD